MENKMQWGKTNICPWKMEMKANEVNRPLKFDNKDKIKNLKIKKMDEDYD